MFDRDRHFDVHPDGTLIPPASYVPPFRMPSRSAMPPAHHRPLSHVSIGVRDYAISKTFYTAIMSQLGLSLVYDSGPEPSNRRPVLGYGTSLEEEVLTIFVRDDGPTTPGPGVHIAFNAASRSAVMEFHQAAMSVGGTSVGTPGLRPEYGENYYAAFVVCPDGWKIEAVCKVPDLTLPIR